MVWREAAANAPRERGAMQLGADRGRGARPAAGRTAQNAEQRADRQPLAELEPGVRLLPGPAVHPDLSPTTALSRTDQNGAAVAVKIGLSQGKRLADPQPGTPEHDDHPTQPYALGRIAGSAHESRALRISRQARNLRDHPRHAPGMPAVSQPSVIDGPLRAGAVCRW
jgi:hypothetical protein